MIKIEKWKLPQIWNNGCIYLWCLCTLYLHACQVRVTAGLCCCTCVSYFERGATWINFLVCWMKITVGETCPKRNFYVSFVIVYLSVFCFEERACPEHSRIIYVVPLKPAFFLTHCVFWTIKRRHFTTTRNGIIRSVTNINILLTDCMIWLHVISYRSYDVIACCCKVPAFDVSKSQKVKKNAAFNGTT